MLPEDLATVTIGGSVSITSPLQGASVQQRSVSSTEKDGRVVKQCARTLSSVYCVQYTLENITREIRRAYMRSGANLLGK